MRTLHIKTALVVTTALLTVVAIYQAKPPASGPTPAPTSLQPAGVLDDDLKKLCQCLDRFGPPAPSLDPTVLPVDVSLEDNTKCKYANECPDPNGCCQPCFDCLGWQLFVA